MNLGDSRYDILTKYDLLHAISRGVDVATLHRTAIAAGMRPMRDVAVMAVKNGITTLEEIAELNRMRIHAAVGMAIYTERLDLDELSRVHW